MDKEFESLSIIIETLSNDKGRVMCRKELDVLIQALQRLESIENANSSEVLKIVDDLIEDNKKSIEVSKSNNYKTDYLEIKKRNLNNIKQYLLKAQKQEKENEILKEIIRSLFDKDCPLHQYIDKDGKLTIEVDSECSTMRLGEYKGVDLDKKLKEVLG